VLGLINRIRWIDKEAQSSLRPKISQGPQAPSYICTHTFKGEREGKIRVEKT